MAIIGQNSLLNQYVPTFAIKDIVDGQCLIYDSVRKAFINTNLCDCNGGGSGGVTRLGELLNVDDQVDNPLSLENGQALVYNSFTQLWENQFIDYNTILNAPLVAVPATEIIFGNSTSTGFTSDPGLTYDSITDTLSTEILTANTIETVVIQNDTSLTFKTNNITRLTINSSGSFNIANSTGSAGQVLTSNGSGSSPTWRTGAGTGTVTSVSASGGTTGMGFLGSPITTSGILTLSGVLNVSNGGTGATTPINAINNLLPPQSGHNGEVLTTNGTNVSWIPGAGTGTVTYVDVQPNNGIIAAGVPITASGTIVLGLGDITPLSVASAGPVTGTNLSGTNTGNQIITLTGDATNSNTSTGGVLTLATVNSTIGTFGSATQVPRLTVDEKGRITNVTNVTISGGGGGSSPPEIVVFHYSSGSAGNFTPGDVIFSQTSGVSVTIEDATNCVALYTFTGKTSLPKSITLYGQNFTTNNFSIIGMPSPNAPQPFMNVVGGGTSANPDLVNGIFNANNKVRLQTTMAFVGASAALGNRAWLIVVFGF